MKSLSLNEMGLCIGFNCKTPSGKNGIILSVSVDCIEYTGEKDRVLVVSEGDFAKEYDISEIKPALRPLHTVTESELEKIILLEWEGKILKEKYYYTISIKQEKRHKIQRILDFDSWVYTIAENGVRIVTGTFTFNSLNPDQFKECLKLRLDIWRWVEAGLAVDISDIKSETCPACKKSTLIASKDPEKLICFNCKQLFWKQ